LLCIHWVLRRRDHYAMIIVSNNHLENNLKDISWAISEHEIIRVSFETITSFKVFYNTFSYVVMACRSWVSPYITASKTIKVLLNPFLVVLRNISTIHQVFMKENRHNILVEWDRKFIIHDWFPWIKISDLLKWIKIFSFELFFH
jgi:hypothetical protein